MKKKNIMWPSRKFSLESFFLKLKGHDFASTSAVLIVIYLKVRGKAVSVAMVL